MEENPAYGTVLTWMGKTDTEGEMYVLCVLHEHEHIHIYRIDTGLLLLSHVICLLNCLVTNPHFIMEQLEFTAFVVYYLPFIMYTYLL